MSLAADQQRFEIACVVNAAYLPHIASLVASLSASGQSATVRLHLLHDGSPPTFALETFRSWAEGLGIAVEFLQPDAGSAGQLPPAGSFPTLIWYRILLAQLLQGLDKVLYLDADILILQDLAPLWNTDLGDNFLAAAAPPTPPESVAYLKKIGFSSSDRYFNSGVLLMNLRQMRQEHFHERVMRAANKHANHSVFPDQDALNIACIGRWRVVHPKWNCLAWSYLAQGKTLSIIEKNAELVQARASPAIVHFEGSSLVKPWHYRSMHPLRHLYRDFRNLTPWPMVKLDGDHFTSRLMHRLPLKTQLWAARLRQAVLRRTF